MGVDITDEHRAAFMACLGDADCDAAIGLAFGLLEAGLALPDLVEGLLAPAQQEVGRRWQHGQWTVADEHAATAVTDVVLSVLAAEAGRGAREKPTVLVTTATEEWHCLPARMVADVLAAAGWSSQLIGPSAPPDDVARFAQRRRPLAAVVSCSMATHLPGAAACIGALHAVGVPVLATGAGYGDDGRLAPAVGADRWAAGPTGALAVLESWADAPPPLRPQPPIPAAHHLLVDRREAVAGAVRSGVRAAGFDEVADLLVEHGVRLVETASLLDRSDVVDDELEWMRSVAVGRGAPREMADEIAAAVRAVVDEARRDADREARRAAREGIDREVQRAR